MSDYLSYLHVHTCMHTCMYVCTSCTSHYIAMARHEVHLGFLKLKDNFLLEYHVVIALLYSLGYSRKNPHPPRRMACWKFSREGGFRALEIWAGGGFEPKKSFLGGHFLRELRFV